MFITKYFYGGISGVNMKLFSTIDLVSKNNENNEYRNHDRLYREHFE